MWQPLPCPHMTIVDLVSVCTLHNLPRYLVACNVCVLVLSVTAKLIYLHQYCYSCQPSGTSQSYLPTILLQMSLLPLESSDLSPRCYCCRAPTKNHSANCATITTATVISAIATILWIPMMPPATTWKQWYTQLPVLLGTNNGQAWYTQLLLLFGFQQCCHPVASIGAPSCYYYLGTNNAVTLFQVLVHPGLHHKQKIAACCSIFILMDSVVSQLP